jgi:hypothetical protein
MIQGVLDGKCNKDIATACGITENTAKVYLSRLFGKVGARSRWELMEWGRAWAEAERRVQAQYRELHPDALETIPTLQIREVTEFEVIKALIQKTVLGTEQRAELAVSLLRDA